MQGDNAGPLRGLKVIEIGMAMAGPFCAMTLGDYGADVIKVERAGSGDEARRWSPFFDAQLSYYFAAANRNKRSLEIDLKTPEGQEVLRRLAADADVVIDNFRVGALDALGLGYEALKTINPRLIYCSISGFGTTGPRAQDRANDIFMQAYAGTMSVTGEENGGPAKAGISVADVGAGMFATIGVLMALEERHRTGLGQRVETSLLEGQIAMLSYNFTYFYATGTSPVRRGASMALSPAYRAFEAADDWIVVAAFTDRMWEGVCRVVGREEWINDPRFASKAQRKAANDELVAELRQIFRGRPVDEWVALLDAEGVPATRVNNIEQVVAEEQVKEREMVTSFEHPRAGTISVAGLPIKLSETPGSVRRHSPMLGEHTEEILCNAGYSADEITKMFESGVVARSGLAAG
jgi:crotonobetainyl-CoA:carnitine CoA-transferase CaiB-like acyl-CoA transferase